MNPKTLGHIIIAICYTDTNLEKFEVQEDAYKILVSQVLKCTPYIITTKQLLQRMFSKYKLRTYNSFPFTLRNTIGKYVYEAMQEKDTSNTVNWNSNTMIKIELDVLIHLVLASITMSDREESMDVPIDALTQCKDNLLCNKYTNDKIIRDLLPGLNKKTGFASLPKSLNSLCIMELEEVYKEIEVDESIPISYSQVYYPLHRAEPSKQARNNNK